MTTKGLHDVQIVGCRVETLPDLETPATPSPAPRASAFHGIAGRKGYILTVFVVDDEEIIASSVAAILKLHGYCATFFTSAVEALAVAQSKAPDLLVSDVAMPGLSGVDLAIQIKAQNPGCKVLLFSGQESTQTLLEDARRQGHSFPFLQKPVHPSVIIESIESLTARDP